MAGIELGEIPLNGRSLEEYSAIFGLSAGQLADKRVLDAAGGPSSFTAEAAAAGARAVAADPVYSLTAGQIVNRSMAQIADIRRKIEPAAGDYNWDFYKDPEDLRRRREAVTLRFAEDFSLSFKTGRYVAAALPRLPFRDSSFDLALCSHFLFLFADRLDYGFHLASLMELARVAAGPALVYPIVGLDGRPYQRISGLSADLGANGLYAELIPARFEFLKGANQTLRITRRPGD